MKRKLAVILLIAALAIGVGTAGCIDGYNELEVEEFKFVEDYDVTGPADLEEREAVYSTDDIYVYTYLEVAGFEVGYDVAEFELEAQIYLDGEHLEDYDTQVTDTIDAEGYDWVSTWFTPNFWDYAGWTPGEYEIEFTETFEVE